MIGSYGGRHGERERYGDRKIELFEVGRNYTELRERVNRERVDNDSGYLPYVETDVATVVNDEFITYLVVTDYTKGDRTILDRDQLHDKIIWNNHINSNDIGEEYDNINNYYIDSNHIMYSIKNDLYRPKVRLLFDDGG